MKATLRVWVPLARLRAGQGTGGGRLPSVLAAIAFAAATWAVLTAAGGTYAFVRRAAAPGADATAGTYVLLAAIACVLLAVPVSTLGAAAARLTVARRNVRLARLRLVGATTFQVSLMALLDAMLEAGAGAVTGCLSWLVTLPLLAQFRFQGRTFAVSELLLPGWLVLAVIAGVLAVAALSCAASLRRVAITPLGVARRVSTPGLRLLRLLPLLIVVAAYIGYSQYSGQTGTAFAVVLLVLLGAAFALFNLIGPLLVGLTGRILARRAGSPATLLAARRLIDDPKSSWRSVGGISLVTFVAGCLSITPGVQARLGAGGQAHLLSDIGTGAFATLGIAALMAAVSTGVTQASRVLDQAPQYRALHLGGTGLPVLHAARARETWIPLLVTMGGAAGTSLLLISPFVAAFGAAALQGAGIFAVSAAAGAALVLLASRASRPLVAAVTRLGQDAPRRGLRTRGA